MNATILLSHSQHTSSKSLSLDLFYIVAGSLLLALAARIAIPLPWTHVPITMQTLAALYLGFKLGPTKSFLAVMCYLAESACGLSVLSCGTANPLAAITGLNAGFLWGMALEAVLMGYFAEKFHTSSLKLLLGAFLAAFLQLAMGTLWLGAVVGFPLAIYLGFLPFIGVELVKAIFLINAQSVFSLNRL